MDFTPTETEQAVRGVAADALEKGGGTWTALASAGLLGLAVPEQHGGDGLGLLEVGVLLHEVGRRAAPLPVWETLCGGVLPLSRCGTPEQQERLLPGVASGEVRLTAALAEPGTALPAAPTTRLRGDGPALRLSGRKVGVSGLDDAAAVLVPATRDDGSVAVAVLDPRSAGVRLHPTRTSRGATEHTLLLDDVAVSEADLLVDTGGGAPYDVLREHALAGLCLLGDGLVAGATDLTAGYVKDRRQFGRALAEFQAVAQQVADVYVASRTIGLAARSAAWRVAQRLPAGDDLAVAAYWLAAEGPAALHTCHHLHGGMGVDVTYPLPRYYGWCKDLVRWLGGEAGSLEAVPSQETAGKNLELTDDQRALKDELRSYFDTLIDPADRVTLLTERHGEVYRGVIKQMGSDRWMGVGWPEEYGGRGFGEVEQQVFANEAARSDVPLPSVTLQTVGPTLQAFGTQKQKDLFLGPILTGDVHFAIGYSEPDAGTDLASLRTTARLVEDDGEPYYLVNGQKMWTTGGHAADYVWLAVRTDPDAPKHQGISVLIVDTKDPGYSWTPIITCDGAHHVNATYYHDVKVPADMLVGKENEGWRLITTQLNHERVMLGPAGRLEGLRDRV
ncbi:MAG TPA: acyl-CoA dehydrogenase, partial [Nocardioides sp.]|nr:acyl-CoA dehydrogenase [Nocardioides sp.]